MMMLELLIIDIIIVIIYGIALIVMLITKASSDEIITATAIYCIVDTIVNGIVYLYPQINCFYNFNKTFTDELSSIKSAFQSTHDKTASLIERMNTEITSKENSIKELQYEIKEIEDIKAQADNFVTNLKNILD